jgi:hypothetical protein
MTQATVTPGRVGAYEALTLENRYLRAVIIPELGARVWELEDRIRGRQWIWHREGVPLASSAPGAVYDDVWAGGWEELFPNDAPGQFEGRTLPDHGEWWTMAWRPTRSESGPVARVCLSATSRILHADCLKEFVLPGDSAEMTVSYRIKNQESGPVHFLFKQHLPVAISPSCRLIVPGGRVRAVEAGFGNILPAPGPFDWPLATGADGGTTDLRVIPPRSSHSREFVYVSELPAPWCAVDDREQQASIRMSFEARTLPFVWLFLSYGGWRDTYTAVLEPCTNLPKDLAEAVRLGQSARLDGDEEYSTTVTISLGPLLEAAS